MQRRTAVAAAGAISISLVAAAAAIGANLGALGFAASSPAPAANVSQVRGAAQISARTQAGHASPSVRAGGEREDEGHESEREPRNETGEHDDD